MGDTRSARGEPYASAASTKAKLIGKFIGNDSLLKPSSGAGGGKLQVPEANAVPGPPAHRITCTFRLKTTDGSQFWPTAQATRTVCWMCWTIVAPACSYRC